MTRFTRPDLFALVLLLAAMPGIYLLGARAAASHPATIRLVIAGSAAAAAVAATILLRRNRQR